MYNFHVNSKIVFFWVNEMTIGCAQNDMILRSDVQTHSFFGPTWGIKSQLMVQAGWKLEVGRWKFVFFGMWPSGEKKFLFRGVCL